MGWTSAVGKTVTMENQQYQVIGMIEDVYSQGIWELVLPSVLRVTTPEQYTAIQIRVQQGAIAETLEYLRKTWIRLFPGIAFQAIFENQAQAEAVRINESVVAVFFFNAVITMFISAMGLFALVSLTIANRTKEVGIRKTLGATVANLISLILKDFIAVLVVAMIIADIGTFALIGALLDAVFVYHTSIGVLALMAGNILVFVIGLGTVLYHTTKAATANPVTALRYE
jgi:putative ABC transport system permease protein